MTSRDQVVGQKTSRAGSKDPTVLVLILVLVEEAASWPYARTSRPSRQNQVGVDHNHYCR